MTNIGPDKSLRPYWFLAFGGLIAVGIFTIAILAVVISDCQLP